MVLPWVSKSPGHARHVVEQRATIPSAQDSSDPMSTFQSVGEVEAGNVHAGINELHKHIHLAISRSTARHQSGQMGL
eukprot:5170557-Amphidinium_carterae.1